MTHNSHIDTSTVSLIEYDVVASASPPVGPRDRSWYVLLLRQKASGTVSHECRWLLDVAHESDRQFLKARPHNRGNGVHAKRTRGEAD